jgi:hypothetical protein
VQDLAGIGPRGEHRVITAPFGVAEPHTLLAVAVYLADEAVHVDDEPLIARAGARPPCSRERLIEHPVELAHVAEGERPKERPERRGRRQPSAQQTTRTTRAQHLAVVDAIGAEQHREDERHHLPARVRRAGPIARQPHVAADQPLDPQPPGERRDQRDPGVRDHALIVE